MEMVSKQGEKMTEEDEEFNRIEREAKQRLEAVKDTIRYRDAFPKDYRLPKPWVSLTDEEMDGIIYSMPYEPSRENIRAIEKLLKEKNEM
jgi:hypothetical protein